MDKTILITSEDIAKTAKDYLTARGYRLRVISDDHMETICSNVGDCCGIIARDGQFTKKVFDSAPHLKVLARHGVGLDIIDVQAATDHAVQVCYTPTANSNSVAEHTIMLMLACARNLSAMDRGVRKGNWAVRDAYLFQEIGGKTLGIIGFGRIGRLVAQKAALGFDMKVLFFQPCTAIDEIPPYAKREWKLDELVKKVDFLTVHAPLTEKTKGMIGEKQFGLMKDTAVIINAARGGIVEEKALYEALSKGKIAGAGLDVFEDEPFEGGRVSPIFSLENVIVTPHTAAKTYEAMERMAMYAAIDVDRVLNGLRPIWPVNHLS